VVVDYRELNSITIKDRTPLPLTADMIPTLQEARVFSKLDLRNAYYLIRIRPGDEHKAAFRTHLGLFEPLVMMFGLCNAPAAFQRRITQVLRPFLGESALVYLDDILVYSRDAATHTKHVREILSALLEARLFVKLSKCSFHQSEVAFLGFLVGSGGLRADPSKIRAVNRWEPPKSKSELQSFLGFANFYRVFVEGYSRIAAPLFALTGIGEFSWGTQEQVAFDTLKSRLTSPPILRFADFSRPFLLYTDASDVALGAVLAQSFE
jgi:hypothetical protein